MSKDKAETDPLFEEAAEIIEAMEDARYIALNDGCGDYDLPGLIIVVLEDLVRRVKQAERSKP